MEKSSIRNIYSRALISILVTLTLTSCYAFMAVPARAASSPTVYVDPPVYRAAHLNEIFQINVKISDVATGLGLIGVEFRLHYNATLLRTKEEWITEGTFFKAVNATYFKAYIEDDVPDLKYIHAFVLLLPSEQGLYSSFPRGSGTVATVTFNATYRPLEPVEASCTLRISDTILVDKDADTVEHTARDGLYQMASLRLPTIAVLPARHVAYREDETFEVDVELQDIDSDWRLTSLQFKLHYDANLLETSPDWIVEGDFLKTYGDTWFKPIVEYGYGLVGVVILPSESGWNGPFPEGEGTIATLKFKAIHQPVEPEASAFCALKLNETILVNDKIEEIPHKTSDGEFVILAAGAYLDQYRPLNIQVDVGAMHFAGEIADFYVLVADYGKAVDADSMKAVLYFKGLEYSDLTGGAQRVAEGLYRVTFSVPADAQTGSYVLLVEAEYLQARGSAIKSFVISSTLKNLNTYISNIKDNIATVVIPAIGQVRLDLSAVNATLVSVSDKVATIGTTLGSITTDVSSLNAKVTKIDGDIATVQTSLGTLRGKIETIEADTATIKTDAGTIKAKVADVPGSSQASINLLYVAVILALIAAIGAVIVYISFRSRAL